MFYDQYVLLCNRKNVSPTKAALENGISKTSVTRWKAGAVPNGDILTKLSAYFDTSIDFLLGKTDIKKPAAETNDGISDQAKYLDKLLKEQGIDPRKLSESDVRKAVAIFKALTENNGQNG